MSFSDCPTNIIVAVMGTEITPLTTALHYWLGVGTEQRPNRQLVGVNKE